MSRCLSKGPESLFIYLVGLGTFTCNVSVVNIQFIKIEKLIVLHYVDF